MNSSKKIFFKLLLLGFLIIFNKNIFPQVAGKGAYAFLNMSTSAKLIAFGTNFISTDDNDISTTWQNPAFLKKEMNNHFFASYNNYVSDIKGGYMAYSRHFNKVGNFVLGVKYLDYGKFDKYLPNGIADGKFTAVDQCVQVGYSNQKNRWSGGVNLKYIYSVYERYVGNGISSDFSAIYSDTSKLLLVSGFIRNLGFQAIPYSGTERQNLETEMALTLSKKLRHLPLRYHFIFSNLNNPNLGYVNNNTNQKDENGNTISEKVKLVDNVLRHLSLAGEIFFSKNFTFRFGYDHQMRREMNNDFRRGMSGMSYGLSLNIKKFHFSYGNKAFFYKQRAHQLSLLVNFSEFMKR